MLSPDILCYCERRRREQKNLRFSPQNKVKTLIFLTQNTYISVAKTPTPDYPCPKVQLSPPPTIGKFVAKWGGGGGGRAPPICASQVICTWPKIASPPQKWGGGAESTGDCLESLTFTVKDEGFQRVRGIPFQTPSEIGCSHINSRALRQLPLGSVLTQRYRSAKVGC